MFPFFRSFRRKPVARASQSNAKLAALQVERLEAREVMNAALWQVSGGVHNLAQTFSLHSNPSAKHVVYLDFDGHTNGNVFGSSWDNLASPAWDFSKNGPSFTDAEKQIIAKVWARVAEDFAPFDVNVTTQDPNTEALRKSGANDERWGIRVVITPDDRPAPGYAGFANIGSFNFGTDTPVYVFTTSEKNVAEAISHEVGHALGLDHDGTSSQEYFPGQGSGATSWGPIMGAAYSPIVTQWSKGEYSGAENKEDDLTKIATQNGFGFRADDYGDSRDAAFALLSQGEAQVKDTYGVIGRNTDSDWFSFWSNAGSISLKVDPLSIGPNLAVRADLYDSTGALVTTVNSPNALNAVVNVSLRKGGQYFLKVSGAGRGNPSTNGFSNYASLGNYRITGTVQRYLPPTGTVDAAMRTFTNNADVVISDNKVSRVTSDIQVSGLTGTLQDVNVKINIFHTFVTDLQITLIAPDGTRVQLYSLDGIGTNLLNTTFDDDAGASISRSLASFNGSFRPSQPLSVLNGKNPNGVWRLEVWDVFRLDGGRIDNWSLTLASQTTPIP